MNITEVILLGLALSLDTFAVSLTFGMAGTQIPRRMLTRFIIVIGLYHTLMVLAGWFMGDKLSVLVAGYDHWIAFILLVLIGAKMISEAFSAKNDGEFDPASLSFARTLLMGLALSIDALITGFTMGMVTLTVAKGGGPFANILISALIIGLCASLMSQTALSIGRKVPAKLSGKAGMLGGVILILIGIKILLEHTLL